MLEHMLPHLFWSAKAGYAYSPVDTAFYVGAALIFGAYWGAKLPRNITRKVCKFLPLFVLLSEFLALLIYFISTEQIPVFFVESKCHATWPKFAKGRTESFGDSARGLTWQSHGRLFPAALQ